MILDQNRSASRGRAMAALSLALLAAAVTAVAAAMPTPLPESPGPAATAKGVEAVRATAPAPAAAAVPADAPTVCAGGMNGSFSGTFGEGPSGTDRNGFQNGDFALQQNLGEGRRLCARVKGPARFDERTGAIRELPGGSSVSVETRGRNRSQRMLVTAEQGEPRYQWWLDGAPRTLDDAARAWLADALEVVAAYRAIGRLEGQVGSLQGEIGSIQGEVGSLQGAIGSTQGQEGSLQGKIGSIQGEEGGLQGQIGGHQGAIGGLEANRWDASASEKTRIDGEIATHQAAIKKLEAEIDSRQFDRRIAEARAELRAAEDKGGREIAELQRKIKDVHAEARISRLEQKIADLHAEDRIAEIERRMKPALDRLKASIQRLGS